MAVFGEGSQGMRKFENTPHFLVTPVTEPPRESVSKEGSFPLLPYK